HGSGRMKEWTESGREPIVVERLCRVNHVEAGAPVSHSEGDSFGPTALASALAPRMLTFPLVPASPEASEEEAANALKRALPGDEVWQEDGKILIVFRSGAVLDNDRGARAAGRGGLLS